MSLITRCPSCLTSFQVTQSQLAQASGWVRCGRCDQIFDGATHMVDSADDDAPVLDAAPGDAVTQHAPGNGTTNAAAAAERPAELEPDAYAPDPGLLTPTRPAQAPPFTEPVIAQDADHILDHIRPSAASDDGPTEPTLDPFPESGDAAPTADTARESGEPRDPVAAGDDAADVAMGVQVASDPVEPPEPADEAPDVPLQATKPAPEAPFLVPAPVTAPATDDGEQAPFEPAPERATELEAADVESETVNPAFAPAVSDPDPTEAAAEPEANDSNDAPRLLEALPRVQPELIRTTTSDQAEPSFVARARRRAFWNHGLVRSGLWLLALLLAAALAGQWALHERDRLAAEYPRWEPALGALCAALDCTVAPYRKLDALAITSSSLKRLNDDAFEFDVSLRNRAGIAVAVPALELTLTDLSERILVRRVIEPAELDAPDRLAANDQWQVQRALVFDANAGAAGVVNYKLQMFYP